MATKTSPDALIVSAPGKPVFNVLPFSMITIMQSLTAKLRGVELPAVLQF